RDTRTRHSSHPTPACRFTRYIEAHEQVVAKLGKPLLLEEFGLTWWRMWEHDRLVLLQISFELLIDSAKRGGPLAGVMFWNAAANFTGDWDGYNIYIMRTAAPIRKPAPFDYGPAAGSLIPGPNPVTIAVSGDPSVRKAYSRRSRALLNRQHGGQPDDQTAALFEAEPDTEAELKIMDMDMPDVFEEAESGFVDQIDEDEQIPREEVDFLVKSKLPKELHPALLDLVVNGQPGRPVGRHQHAADPLAASEEHRFRENFPSTIPNNRLEEEKEQDQQESYSGAAPVSEPHEEAVVGRRSEYSPSLTAALARANATVPWATLADEGHNHGLGLMKGNGAVDLAAHQRRRLQEQMLELDGFRRSWQRHDCAVRNSKQWRPPPIATHVNYKAYRQYVEDLDAVDIINWAARQL
ncbi:hypothetical protein Vretimale_8550, partial [Volvox reticuliferus]